ncbi:MAG: AAA-like domain-containing protein [Verrucomicrobia bacterium]|nr:AAA-like domain-containing protein [Verrucomicrobiota bacterium]
MNSNDEIELTGAKVLIVDDVSANLKVLRGVLEPCGYKILLAPRGEVALKIARSESPDLILLDVMMPEMDGFEVCRGLKEEPATAGIPVIFISANEGTQSVVDGFRAGGVDYVTKPFKAEEVVMRVETHLQNSRLTRALRERNGELSKLNGALQAEVRRRQQAEQALSLLGEQQSERFHVGGTLRHDAVSYIERQADRDLLATLTEGAFCYVLTARQMGKSSLMARVANILRQKGWDVVTLDLSALGQMVTPEQWYDGLIARIGWQLKLEDALDRFWSRQERLGPLQRFLASIREIVLARSARRLVIFVDELDTVRSLPFPSGDFFGAIRETYNRRSEDPTFDRLTFCLLGVATPSELIACNAMTTFNIGRRIELQDFTWPEVLPLAHGLGRNTVVADELLERIYFWTAGHPYLTQKLCHAVSADATVQTEASVDEVCHRTLLSPQARGQDDNLIFVRERLQRGQSSLPALLPLYRRVRAGESVPVDETRPEIHALRLSGIVRYEGEQLRVRNRIYERVFDVSWVDRACGRDSDETTKL